MASAASFGSTSIKGRAWRISSAVHSGFSASGRLAFFRIRSFLAPIGSAQTDHANLLASRRDDSRVQQAIEETKNAQSAFAVVLARIVAADSAVGVEISEALETDPSLLDVPGAFRFVEFEQKHYIVYINSWQSREFWPFSFLLDSSTRGPGRKHSIRLRFGRTAHASVCCRSPFNQAGKYLTDKQMMTAEQLGRTATFGMSIEPTRSNQCQWGAD
jgi:hypothetical protein